jgi:hypothetical protein
MSILSPGFKGCSETRAMCGAGIGTYEVVVDIRQRENCGGWWRSSRELMSPITPKFMDPFFDC